MAWLTGLGPTGGNPQTDFDYGFIDPGLPFVNQLESFIEDHNTRYGTEYDMDSPIVQDAIKSRIKNGLDRMAQTQNKQCHST